ncbi:MAG: hypothetical protein WAV70_16875, partial [Anaerolineae bacterium]
VHFYGRMGGSIPLPDEILNALHTLVSLYGTVQMSGHNNGYKHNGHNGSGQPGAALRQTTNAATLSVHLAEVKS